MNCMVNLSLQQPVVKDMCTFNAEVLQMSSQMHQAADTEKQLALRHERRGHSRDHYLVRNGG